MSEPRHVLFEAGGLPLAVPADAVQAIHDELALQRVEGTRPWFLGLAVADGRLLPVTDLGAWLGLRASGGRTLQLHADVGIAGFRVDTVYGLSDADADIESEAAETAAEPARSSDGSFGGGGSTDARAATGGGAAEGVLTALTIVEDGRQHRILDLAGLLQSPEFLDIAADDT